MIPAEAGHYGVIVCGGGPAGLGASLAAAKMGAKTLLLEARSFFGGEGPVGLWMPVNRLMLDNGNRGGIHDFFVDKLRKYGSDAMRDGINNGNDGDGFHIHPEYLKMAAYDALEEANCHYRLYSPVVDVIMDVDKIRGVVVATKDGHQSFTADVIIDATGDGDVAYRAGVEMVKGREEDGQFMAFTTGFALCNVDVEKFMDQVENNYKELMELIHRASEQDKYQTVKNYWFYRTTIPSVVSVNNSGTGLGPQDGTKSDHLTMGERFGLRLAIDFVNLARAKSISGLENCSLFRVGTYVGIRETRRIVGEYVLNVDDALQGVQFEDNISRRYGAIDAVYYFARMKSGFGYPYRCMLPKKIDYLLAAGRCGSATHLGHAAGKSMGNMMGIGQAAGIAAAIASKQGVTPRSLNVKDIQRLLIDWDVKLFD